MALSIIDASKRFTVQTQYQAPHMLPSSSMTLSFASTRSDALPPYGTRERERVLRDYDRHEYAGLWRGASAGLINRWINAAWELKVNQDNALYNLLSDSYNDVLSDANFGAGWGAFVAEVGRAFLRHDTGAFIEIIGAGDPMREIVGPVYGIAILDTLSCRPTGDSEYPVIYIDPLTGQQHNLHYTRVWQIVDQPDGDARIPGWGHCALSRAIAVIERDILMNRYTRTRLDDEPPPGIAIFTGMNEDQQQRALATWYDQRNRDQKPPWGRTISFFSMDVTNKISVDFVPFAQAGDSFNLREWKELNVNELALELGVDKLDLWEITSSGLGSGQQAQIMAAKSKGRTFGAFLTAMERFINQILPNNMEFAFQVPDSQEDAEHAANAQVYANVANMVRDVLGPDERRRMLANQVPAIADAITDAAGNVQRYDDIRDQVRPDAQVSDDVPADAAPAVSTPELSPLTAFGGVFKDFSGTASAFVDAMASLFERADTLHSAQLKTLMRARLRVYGERAYLDGLEAGGSARVMGRKGKNALITWLNEQQQYIDTFALSSKDSASTRAQLWANKSLREVYFTGLANADETRLYRWQLGSTIEHCADCLTFNGQTKTAAEWAATGKLPGSSALECKGFECKCTLELADIPRAAAPSLLARARDYIRRLIGRR